MVGFQPKLPLDMSTKHGHVMLQTIKETVQQNLKMLILTCPGEKCCPEPGEGLDAFGVCLRSFLFEQNNPALRQSIETKMRQQISKYCPWLQIDRITFSASATNDNALLIGLSYGIVPTGETDFLQVSQTLPDNMSFDTLYEKNLNQFNNAGQFNQTALEGPVVGYGNLDDGSEGVY